MAPVLAPNPDIQARLADLRNATEDYKRHPDKFRELMVRMGILTAEGRLSGDYEALRPLVGAWAKP